MKLALLVSAGLLEHAMKELEAKTPLEVAGEMCAIAELVTPAELRALRCAIKAKTENKENNVRTLCEPKPQFLDRALRNPPRLAF